MDEQHKHLIDMLENFLREFNKEPFESGLILEKFKVYVERHFSIEEVAIFNTYESMDSDNVENTFQLMQEHQTIMALFNKIENELGEKAIEDVKELERMLNKHRQFEDETFYPRLDEELNENQKVIIIGKIKEKILI
jgi:hemerythrin